MALSIEDLAGLLALRFYGIFDDLIKLLGKGVHDLFEVLIEVLCELLVHVLFNPTANTSNAIIENGNVLQIGSVELCIFFTTDNLFCFNPILLGIATRSLPSIVGIFLIVMGYIDIIVFFFLVEDEFLLLFLYCLWGYGLMGFCLIVLLIFLFFFILLIFLWIMGLLFALVSYEICALIGQLLLFWQLQRTIISMLIIEGFSFSSVLLDIFMLSRGILLLLLL